MTTSLSLQRAAYPYVGCVEADQFPNQAEPPARRHRQNDRDLDIRSSPASIDVRRKIGLEQYLLASVLVSHIPHYQSRFLCPCEGSYYTFLDQLRFQRTFPVVGIHCAGEICDVVVGGVLDVPAQTMYEKMIHFWTKADQIRQLLLNEPRGSAAMCANLILPPCDARADAGFLTMEHEEYPPMSGANTIATATVLLEIGMVPMQEPISRLTLDTAAGLVNVTAECESGRCTTAAFDNVPAFVFVLDLEIPVPGLGTVKVDIAWGGMFYVVVDATTLGLKIENTNGAKLVEVGERIKAAVQQATNPVHPENTRIRGVTILQFTEPLRKEGTGKTAVNTVVVSHGRLDRSPCGTGTCARLAILHARGLLDEGEPFLHRSVIGTEFVAHIRGTTKVGNYPAVLPTVKGSAWVTSFKQVVLDPTDPFPQGFRVGDSWHMQGGL